MPELDKPLVVVVGETASGKSGLAMKIAEAFDGEIIAADSRTIYRGMDIGTAKPSQEEQQTIVQHGLDVVEPGQDYNVADFQRDAKAAIQDISSRNKLPIMVGGTGLYIDSVLFDFDFGKPKNEALRTELSQKNMEELQSLAQQTGLEVSNEMLKNKRHLIRAIETAGAEKGRKELRLNTLVIGVNLTKNQLRKRVVTRVELMFRKGLRKEVDELVDKYGWDNEAMTGIGYREFKDYYDGNISMSKVKETIVRKTMQYAKRQRTWFKRNRQIEWFDSPDKAFDRVGEYLENHR